MPTILITGGHSGIGFECSKQLASAYGFNLILAGRSPDQMEKAAQELRSACKVKVNTIKLDTSSLDSVRSAAPECRSLIDSRKVDSLNGMICNAGVRLNGYSYSADGYEKTIATNYLGHYLLVDLLLGLISEHGRIVFTVSGTHDPDTMDGKLVGKAAEPDANALVTIGKDGTKSLSPGQLYTTSKLCMVLHAYELARRLQKSGSTVESIAFDPGGTSGTGFLREMPKPVQWLSNSGLFTPLVKLMGVTMGSVSFSGASLAKITADASFAHASGKYFQSHNGKLIERKSSKVSYDEQRALKLWNDTKVLVRLQPGEEPAQLR